MTAIAMLCKGQRKRFSTYRTPRPGIRHPASQTFYRLGDRPSEAASALMD
jgi:hypothetical protein